MFAKKSLGQHFLNSPHAINEIVRAGKVDTNDTVLEIGPGKGVLTKALLEHAKKVIAIEKDDRMIPLLEEKFKREIANGKLKIVHGDILEQNSNSLDQILTDTSVQENNLDSTEKETTSYKLIANIPYYITGEIVKKFFEEKNQPSLMVLMVQKEVAQRIVANDNKESILSISVKVYGVPTYVKTVKASCFIPKPQVDSAILLIDSISKKFFEENKVNEKRFFEIVKAGFAHKRKLLAKNLESVTAKEKIEQAFIKENLPPKTRAEDLSIQQWKLLAADLA